MIEINKGGGLMQLFNRQFELNELATLSLGIIFIILLLLNIKSKILCWSDIKKIPYYLLIDVSFVCFYIGLFVTVIEDVTDEDSFWHKLLNFFEHISFVIFAMFIFLWSFYTFILSPLKKKYLTTYETIKKEKIDITTIVIIIISLSFFILFVTATDLIIELITFKEDNETIVILNFLGLLLTTLSYVLICIRAHLSKNESSTGILIWSPFPLWLSDSLKYLLYLFLIVVAFHFTINILEWGPEIKWPEAYGSILMPMSFLIFFVELGVIKYSEVESLKKKFQTLLDRLPMSVYVKNDKLEYIACNNNFASSLNIKREDIIGKTDINLSIENNSELTNQDKDQTILNNKRESYRLEQIKKDDHYKWVTTLKIPHMDLKNDKVLEILSFSYDEIEFDYKDLFDFLFDNVTNVVLLVAADSKEIIKANEAASALFGLTNNKLTKMTISNIHNEYYNDFEQKLNEIEQLKKQEFYITIPVKYDNNKTMDIKYHIIFKKFTTTDQKVKKDESRFVSKGELVFEYDYDNYEPINIMSVDTSICNMLGKKKDEFEKKNFLLTIHPVSMHDKVKNKIKEVVKNKKTDPITVPCLCSYKTQIDVHITIEKVSNGIKYTMKHIFHEYYLFIYNKTSNSSSAV
jgi:PAS domain-containing protein